MIVTDALLTLEKVEDKDPGKEEVDQAGGGNTKRWVVCWVEAQETEAKHQGNLMYSTVQHMIGISKQKTLLLVGSNGTPPHSTGSLSSCHWP